MRFYPFLIGLSFLIPLDLTFSTWFFFLFRKLERLVGAITGWNTIPQYPFFGEQATGAMIGLCVIALYMGRRYFIDVFKKVVGMQSELDDTDEPMRYRTAVLCLIGGMIALMIYCSQLGMSLWLVPLFFGLYFNCHSAYTDACGIGPSLTPNRLGEPTSGFGRGAWNAHTRPRQFDHVFAILLVQPTQPKSPNAPSVRSIQDR